MLALFFCLPKEMAVFQKLTASVQMIHSDADTIGIQTKHGSNNHTH